MTASAKRKKEKKKDFQKPKLKVGKAKAKADNFTSTAFSSKSISLKKQSLSTAAPSAQNQVAHHLSLLRNRSDTQRLESLSFLTNLSVSDLESYLIDILPKLPPLIHDPSPRVRTQLLKILKRLPKQSLITHHEQLLLWTRAAMTHLSSDIRSFSLDMLELLLSAAAQELVSCRGGWVLTLRCFMTVLGWKKQGNTSGWSVARKSNSITGGEAKELAKQLTALASFIRAGIEPPSADAVARWHAEQAVNASREFPFVHVRQNQLPELRNPYAHLDLFGEASKDEGDVMLQDRDERREAFHDKFLLDIQRGNDEARKQGGEVGRAAAVLKRAVDVGMS